MSKRKDIRKSICAAAIKLAGKQPWKSVSLSQISKETKLPLAQIKKTYSNTSAILPDLIRNTDKEVILRANVNLEDSAHDRLFEVLMTRFDVLQKNRKSILSIAHACKNEPAVLHLIFRAQIESMQNILMHTNLLEVGAVGMAKIFGLFVVYQYAFAQWTKDETKDMSKTMAALDKSLNKAHTAAILLGYSQ